MNYSDNNTLLQNIQTAKMKGFTTNFLFENNKLVDRESNNNYSLGECILVGYYKYVGLQNPSVESILFLIKCHDTKKGYLISDYGLNVNINLGEFLKSLLKDFYR